MDRETALRELSKGSPELQHRAARVLGRWSDDQVVAALIDALQSPHRGIREAAADTLLEIGDARTVRKLVPLLRSSQPAVRNSARVVLQRLANAAPEILDDLARDPDVRMRIFAANIMSETGDHEFAAPLIRLLDDADENVRDAAINGLGLLGAPEAIHRLEEFALNGSSWIRFSAIDALSQIQDPDAVRALLRLLDRVPSELQEPVLDALGRQASPEAIAPLLQMLRESSPFRSTIVGILVGSLAAHVPDRATDGERVTVARALSRTLEENGLNMDLTVAALDLLGELGVAGEAAPVLRLLESGEERVQRAAIRAALTLRLPQAVPILERLQGRFGAPLSTEIKAGLSSMVESRKENS